MLYKSRVSNYGKSNSKYKSSVNSTVRNGLNRLFWGWSWAWAAAALGTAAPALQAVQPLGPQMLRARGTPQ